ncbi:poxvirus/kinetoplastid-type cap-specific nucleoside 2-O-methyltransferase, partial [Kipferlia bialata]
LPHGAPVPEADLMRSLRGSYGMSGACWLLEPSEEDHKAMLASVDGYGSRKYGDRVFCAGPDEQLVSLHYMRKSSQGSCFTPWTNIGRAFNCVSWQKDDIESGKLSLLPMPKGRPGVEAMPVNPRRYRIAEDGSATLIPESAMAPLPEPEPEAQGMEVDAVSALESDTKAESAVRVLHYVTEKPWNADPAAPSREKKQLWPDYSVQEKKQLWPDYRVWYESLTRLKTVLGDDADLQTPAKGDKGAVPILPTSWAEDQFVTQEEADKAFGKTPAKRPASSTTPRVVLRKDLEAVRERERESKRESDNTPVKDKDRGAMSTRRQYNPEDIPEDESRPEWARWQSNPHTKQYVQMVGEYPPIHEEQVHRLLPQDAPQAPYRRRRGEAKSVLHWGQRKLFFSEVEFLTMFAAERDRDGGYKPMTAVYAGAAPGTHTAQLSSMFPHVTFDLWDPNPFTVRESDMIILNNGFFTDEVAAKYAGRSDVLFISDIRTADPSVQSEKEVEEYVQKDMVAQQRWYELMRPAAAMLKFRLPWASPSMPYLDGKVMLPIWGPQTTTESRLIPTPLMGLEKDRLDLREREREIEIEKERERREEARAERERERAEKAEREKAEREREKEEADGEESSELVLSEDSDEEDPEVTAAQAEAEREREREEEELEWDRQRERERERDIASLQTNPVSIPLKD